MLFNPHVIKQAQEVIFLSKSRNINHPTAYFKNFSVVQTNCTIYLGILF